jgi:opacity protein-like surface antigen
MKKIVHLFTLISLVVCFQAYTEEEKSADEGYYISLLGGGAFLSKYTADRPAGTKVETAYDTGFLVGASLGYRWSERFRAEVEFTHRNVAIDALVQNSGTKTEGSGSFESYSFMANGFFHWVAESDIQPYIGFGAGFTRLNINDNTSGFTSVASSDEVFTYQTILGIDFDFWENVRPFFEYRYLGTAEPKLTDTAGADFEAEIRGHHAILGVKFLF